MPDAQKLTLEWTQLEDGSRALVFDADTWAAFEEAAQAQRKTAHQLISTAIAASVGTVIMDRWLTVSYAGTFLSGSECLPGELPEKV